MIIMTLLPFLLLLILNAFIVIKKSLDGAKLKKQRRLKLDKKYIKF